MNNTYFYHPDHLGSTSLVTNSYGEITQNISYIPYGEVFVEETAGGWQSPYYFNAKELDEETGLYYYGARYLDPAGTRWLSADPMFEKYVGMSPYNYCAGNPVRLVDPDGKNLGILVDGESYKYDPNIKKNEYKGNNATIGKFVSNLNKINSTKIGNMLLNALHKSRNDYVITNQTTSKEGTKGTVKNGKETLNKMGNSCTMLQLAHELFHSYQHEKGQGGCSVWNEVEAYVYSNRVIDEYDKFPHSEYQQPDGFEFAKEEELNSSAADDYQKACQDLLKSKNFNQKSFDVARSFFRRVSQMNESGVYSKPPYKFELPTNKKHLLKDFY